MFEHSTPKAEAEERSYIQSIVCDTQKEMSESGFPLGKDYGSAALIEIESRMQRLLSDSQFDLFKKMREERNSFPWPKKENE